MRKIFFCLILLVTLIPVIAFGSDHSSLIKKNSKSLVKLYKYLHSHPELSRQEKKTSKKMAVELEKAGFEVTENIGGYGVVGVYKNGDGPVVMVRTDMDALPIKEETGLPYASKVKAVDEKNKKVSVMHACGHDMHMTVFIGTARLLMKLKDQWKGTLMMVAQPSEENIGGAKAMIEDGLFKRFPHPDYALALHVMPMPSVMVSYKEGYMFAGSSSVDITVRGIGGHGAYPHGSKDPIVLSASMIEAFQTIISRETDSKEPAVITVGSIHGGTARNIIPEEVKMALTIRAYPDKLLDTLVKSVKRVAEGTAIASGFPKDRMPVFTEVVRCPSVYNDPKLTRRIVKAFKKNVPQLFKSDRIIASEDFAHYRFVEPKFPTVIFGIGVYKMETFVEAQKKGTFPPAMHNPKFGPDDVKTTIKTGVNAMSTALFELLGK